MEFTLYQQFPLEIQTEWNDLLKESISHVPFLRFEYLHEWWNTRGGGEWPDDSELCIITAREDGQLIGIAPLFITDHEDEQRLLLLGSIEISDFLDVICRTEDLERFISALLAYLIGDLVVKEKLRAIDLYNILEDSPTLSALKAIASTLALDYYEEKLQHSPYVPLPGDWETYLAGIDKKQRHEIRRKIRRAEEGEKPVSLYLTVEAGKLEDDMDDFLELMAQDESKAEFLSPLMAEQMKLTMRCAFNAGCLQLAFLIIGEVKAAAYLNFDFLDRVWVYNSGLDRRFMEYSPGWVLLGYLLKKANEDGRKEFDFMRGDEDYKYKFGGIDRFVMRARISF